MTDPVTGETMSEREYIQKQGRLPIENNLIRPIVFNLVGQYRQMQPTPYAIARNSGDANIGDMITSALRYALDINDSKEIDAAEMLEMVLSGSFGFKSRYMWMPELNRDDVMIDCVDQTRLFHNPDLGDRRTKNLNFIGEIHDYTIDEVIRDFAESPEDAERIRRIYSTDVSEYYYHDFENVSMLHDNRDFLIPNDPNMVRVIETWTLEYDWQMFVTDEADGRTYMTDETMEEVALRNQARIDEGVLLGLSPDEIPLLDVEERYEPQWVVYFLTPYGDILFSAVTPYAHELCPYDLGVHPYVDGKVSGIVEMIIGQQRQFNRLLSQLDESIKNSNKGWWMVPREVLGKGQTEQDFVDQTVSYGNYVFYNGEDLQNKEISPPKFIQGQSIPVGVERLADLQRGLIKEITGVVSSMQGHAPSSNTPAALYAQQTANASTTQVDLFQYFNSVIRRRNKKVAMLQRQFYEEERFVKTSSFAKPNFDHIYRPDSVQDIDFDIALGEAQNNTVYRQMIDNYLLDFVGQGLIHFEDFLETTTLPFADHLLNKVRDRKQAMAEQQQEQEIPADVNPQDVLGQQQLNKLQQAA